MNSKPASRITVRSKPDRTHARADARGQRQVECFRVLAAVAALLPPTADTNGRAPGTLGVAEFSSVASVSRKTTARALRHWQNWRVLWLFWKGHRVWDVRFERTVVEAILAAKENSPRELGRLLKEHRRQREAIAPWNSRQTLVEVAPPAAA